MRKVGNITETETGWRLQYKERDDRGNEVVESASVYKFFPTKEDALTYATTNDIEIENITSGLTNSFTCPKCKEKGITSWTKKRKDGSFHCPKCNSSYSSQESANYLRKQ